MYRILNHIYNVEGLRIGRVYVIEGNDGLSCIDTSISNSLSQIQKGLQKIGYELKDIKHILITHAHPDHIGSLAALKEATGAKIFAHYRYESAVIRGEKPMLRPVRSQLRGLSTLLASLPNPNLTSVRVDYELKEGDRLDEVLPGLEVVDTPGHSPGHCGFWQPDQRLLFGGDVMMRLPFNLHLPLASFTADMDEAKRSIRKVAEMGVATLCLGHGKPYIGNAAAAIQAFVKEMH